jgi:hypothetical protein
LTACTGQQTTPPRQPARANTAAPTAAAPTETAAAPALTPTAKPSQQPTPTHAAPQARDTLLLAHTMPWYQSEEISGAWGWHWTMNHFDPAQGELASHYTPLTGPYDSNDPALLEYQVLLMKLAGIDGVIVDWYGTADFWDYPANQRGAQMLFTYAQKAGLKFGVCYEDQTLKHMLDNQHLQAGEDIVQAQADMRFMQQVWFQDPIYLKQKDRPVLLVFGPQHFKDAAEWKQVFAGLDPAPLLVSEDTILWDAALSSYPWPPMGVSNGGVLSQKALDDYLTAFYLRAAEQPYRVAGAFPGFDDIYQEAGVSAGYGGLDARGGDTFRDTLERAAATNPDVIQLITWNDYGEGTNIEPAQEYGYLYLEILQEFRRQNIQPGFSPQPADLRLPLELYHLRKQHAGDAAVNAALDQVFAAIVSGDMQLAAALLQGIK